MVSTILSRKVGLSAEVKFVGSTPRPKYPSQYCVVLMMPTTCDGTETLSLREMLSKPYIPAPLKPSWGSRPNTKGP